MKQITPTTFFVWFIFLIFTFATFAVFLRNFSWHYHEAQEKKVSATRLDEEICSKPQKVEELDMERRCKENHEILHRPIVMEALVVTIEQYYICRGVNNCALVLYTLWDKLVLVTIFLGLLMILITVVCGCSVFSNSRYKQHQYYELPTNLGTYKLNSKKVDSGKVDLKKNL